MREDRNTREGGIVDGLSQRKRDNYRKIRERIVKDRAKGKRGRGVDTKREIEP